MKDKSDLVKGWLQKAESDLVNAKMCLDNRQALDTACFHAQQAAEKMLKAYLITFGIKFPFIHDLGQLIDLCVLRDPDFEQIRSNSEQLTPYAVELRYDVSFSPELERAREAYEQAIEIKNFVMDRLPPEMKA